MSEPTGADILRYMAEVHNSYKAAAQHFGITKKRATELGRAARAQIAAAKQPATRRKPTRKRSRTPSNQAGTPSNPPSSPSSDPDTDATWDPDEVAFWRSEIDKLVAAQALAMDTDLRSVGAIAGRLAAARKAWRDAQEGTEETSELVVPDPEADYVDWLRLQVREVSEDLARLRQRLAEGRGGSDQALAAMRRSLLVLRQELEAAVQARRSRFNPMDRDQLVEAVLMLPDDVLDDERIRRRVHALTA